MADLNAGNISAGVKIETTGAAAALKGLESALDAVNKKLIDLFSEMAVGSATSANLQEKYDLLMQASERLRRKIAETEEQARHESAVFDATATTTQVVAAKTDALVVSKKKLGEAQAEATRRANQFTLAMMQVGYIVDDSQYGFQALVNNISPFVTSVTAAAGATPILAASIGATAQIMGVLAYQTGKHIDALKEWAGITVVETEAQHMEKLEHATHKTAEQQREYNKLKREEADIQKLLTTRPEVEQKAKAGLEKAVTEGDVDAVKKALAQGLAATEGTHKLTPDEKIAIRGEHRESDPNLIRVIRDLQTVLQSSPASFAQKLGEQLGLLEQKRTAEEEAAEKQIQDKESKNLDDRINQILTDPKKLATLKTQVAANPGAFPPGFLRNLEEASPEFQQRKAIRKRDEQDEADEAKLLAEQNKEDVARNKRIEDKEKEDKKRANEERREEKRGTGRQAEIARMILPDADRTAGEMAASAIARGANRDAAIASMKGQLMRPNAQGQFMTEEDAETAAKGMAGTRFDEFSRSPQKLREFKRKQKSEEKARQKAAVEDVEDIDPRFMDDAEGVVGRARVAGVNDMMLKRQISAALRRKGIGDEQAGLAADAMIEKGGEKFDKRGERIREAQQRDFMEQRGLGGLRDSGRMSEIFATASLNDKIQAGVGGDDAKNQRKEQTGLQKEIRDMVRDLSRQQGAIRIN